MRQSNSRVRSLSSAFNSESRAKIKEAILKGRDYLMTKVQDYQQRIRTNMNSRQRDMPNNHASETGMHDLVRSDCSHSADGFCSSYREVLPSYEELMQLERPPDTMTDNQNSGNDLVTVNVQDSQEYASTNEANADREPLLEELPEAETLPDEATDLLNQASSLVASGDDDLPLGTEANTLSGIPSGATLSSHGSEIIGEQSQSPLLPPKTSPSLLHATSLPTGNTHPWLQALSGRQQSFGSDLSTGTTSSVNSIEILLQGREADPEEILMSLGFGSTEDSSALTSRIPSRFLMLNSEAHGVNIDDFLGQRSELQELIENWNCQKYTSGSWNHTPRLSPYLHGIRFLSSVRAAACKSSTDTVDSIPNSILTPDNQLALARQGYYDSFPALQKEESPTVQSTTTPPTASKPLSASEKRQKYKCTRSSRPWSLIEPETNIEPRPTVFRPSTSTLATSIDSSVSSDNVDRSWTGKQRSVSELRWSYLNRKSKDSLSSTSSISQARQIQVSMLMNNEEDDGDYQILSQSPRISQIDDVFFEDQSETRDSVGADCTDGHCADVSSIATQTSHDESSWKCRSTISVFGGDCIASPVKQSTPEKCADTSLCYLADRESSYLEPELSRQDQDPYRDAMPSCIDLEDPNASHVPPDSSDLRINTEMSSIHEGISSFSEQEDEKIQKEITASQEKSPVICRYESAQSDSSGFAEPDVVVVNVPFPNLDSLSVHKGSCDSFDTISSGRLQRLSINSDSTIKEIADQSPYAIDSDFTQISVCDKSTTTDLPARVDKEILTDPSETSHKAIQTDTFSWCQCLASPPRYKPPMLGQLSKSTALRTHSTLLNYPPITDDPLTDIRNLTSFDSGFSPSKHEVSVLNLYVYDGKIWFCDNDSSQSSKWSISGGQSTSSVHMYDQVCQEPADSTDYARSTRYGEFGEFSHLKQMTTMNSKPSSKNKLTTSHHISLDSHEDDHLRKPSARLNTKEQIREYKKLLKLTNQRFTFQCLMKNTIPLYSPRFQIDIWCERHIDEHLQEENQLMQYAVQRYKSDLQVMESAFLTEFNRSGGLLSEEDTLLMDELYELWTDISLEVVHLERLLADRQRLIRRGECELTTLTTLDVIQTMVEVLKEQLYLFHINNDIVESSSSACDRAPSPPPICHHPGWKDISKEVHELRHQITGHDTLQAIHLKKAVEEIKDTVLCEIHQEVTHNLSKLSAR